MSSSPALTDDAKTLRKRQLARDRARRYREKKRQNDSQPVIKISQEQKKENNRLAQREHREREATW